MMFPALVYYSSMTEYQAHYERVYCRGKILTFDGIRVYFSPIKFGHIFYESTFRDGHKDLFSKTRAERIDWIKATLEHPKAMLFQGWNKERREHDPIRRVAVVFEDFVVIIAIRMKRNNKLGANFVTCYKADNSIRKIRHSPSWSYQACLGELEASQLEKEEGR